MKSEQLIKSIIGEELYESLKKSLEKIPTSSVVDLQEMYASLNIAPKTLVAFLIRELRPMPNGTSQEIRLPFEHNTFMLVNKQGPDVYNGHIRVGGRIVHEFRFTAIPQLAAHIMSTFEMHDDSHIFDKEEIKEEQESPKVEALETKVDNIESKLTHLQMQLLENKINELMRLVANSPAEASAEESSEESSEESAQKAEPQIKIETLKAEPALAPKPTSSFSKEDLHNLKNAGSIKKAGLMPKMPNPPKAGSMGGVQGAKTGMIGMKTMVSDTKVTQHKPKNPYLKTTVAVGGPVAGSTAPSLKASEGSYLKTLKMSLGKSENSQCPDCGQPEVVSGNPVRCACFQALSEPKIQKSENGTVSVSFKSDWDTESIETLYTSLMRRKNGLR